MSETTQSVPVLALVKRNMIWLAPVLACILGVLMWQSGWPVNAAMTAALTLLCALWWMFEPIPIPATSLIPLGVFPLLGILSPKDVALAYGSPLIILLMGGAMLSKAMEKSGAHRRVALGMVGLFGGGSQRRLVLGFMAASALLSMWISNTATTLMLLPVALAVLEKSDDRKLMIALLLGIAYAASIGGLGTPIGTPANVIMMQAYQDATGVELTFVDWMQWSLPVVILLVPLAGFWLSRKLGTDTSMLELPELGGWRKAERRVMLIFALTALAWITLKGPSGGWGQWLPTANYGSVALFAVLVLFIIPDGEGGRLLDWQSANQIHWGVLLLFAGGIAIAKAFTATGLSQAIGEALAGFNQLPVLLLLVLLGLGVAFLTEVTSNTATATLLMPILAATAIAAEMEPALIMLPAALASSCAFMLPVATAPNAIVFGTGQVRIADMVSNGFAINLIAVLVISGCSFVLLTLGAFG
ncbi:SLC13 family permease [Pseudoteredinibacter isoporae]|uniref:Sodium-dependent dicarboxylate transporter 2/3/5 n=1 Tax=Pseudoteredinibacter isoporae TaxID=570281 RepID=A0A7X0JWS1_9GAMM|nr:SLC13 family permease [Pseudoteredinibacter isoporae]MBB6522940.1 sodium-dependent dicarboxylate transporter 2/3/5 [Pseudoteredinibacter isoporae]NHO88466.1 SLC13/DASS family transporter [Pseudoteredinibacter isoporae]NIB22137.1 SLC13/DASS family transporter [Pseudoteredinibacter isoporae]